VKNDFGTVIAFLRIQFNFATMAGITQLALKYIPRHRLHIFAHWVLRAVSPFMRGKTFEDPITGISYRIMLSYGRGRHHRENVLAPDSLSLERHRLMWLVLKQKTSFFTEPTKLLHVAPEYCFLKIFRNMDNLEYTTADLNSPWADIHMDVHEIPMEDNSFDAIICNHVLEHVDDDAKVMSEFVRVMKPGGWGIFQVPIDMSRAETLEDPSITDPKEREKIYWQEDHVRLYGRDYPQKLEAAGFKVEPISMMEEIDPELVRKYALSPGEIVYFCTKPI